MKTRMTYGVRMLFLLLIGALLPSCKELEMKNSASLTYFFDKPAKVWEETFPLGNGRLGLMPDGGITRENFVLNEISLWSGSEQDTDNPNAYYALSSIRRLLFEGRNDEAQSLMYQTFVCKGAGSGLGDGANLPYGSYQIFGNLTLDYAYDSDLSDAEKSYRRELDLSNAIATTTFRHKGVNYIRESFASFSDDVGVIYLSADIDKSLNFSVKINRPEHATCSVQSHNMLWMKGQLPDGVDTTAQKGMRFASAVRILLPKGGQLTSDSSSLSVKEASEAILLVGMATDYFGKEPESEVITQLEAAGKKSYTLLKSEHIDQYHHDGFKIIAPFLFWLKVRNTPYYDVERESKCFV